MEKLGRKNIQMLGFFMMFILYIALSQLLTAGKNGAVTASSKVSPSALLFLYVKPLRPPLCNCFISQLRGIVLTSCCGVDCRYGLTFFFANFGPNSTTFILPSETFPAEVRTSLNGFSAAMGKTGAAIGSAMFLPLAQVSR